MSTARCSILSLARQPDVRGGELILTLTSYLVSEPAHTLPLLGGGSGSRSTNGRLQDVFVNTSSMVPY